MKSGALKAPRCPWAARRPRFLPPRPSFRLPPPPPPTPPPPGGGAGPGLGPGPARRPEAGAAPCRTPVGGWRSTPSTRIGNGTTGAPGTSPPPTWSGWRGCRCWCAPSRTVRAWPGLRGGLGRPPPPPGPGPPPLAPPRHRPLPSSPPGSGALAAPLGRADTRRRRRRAWLLLPYLPALIGEDPRGFYCYYLLSPFFPLARGSVQSFLPPISRRSVYHRGPRLSPFQLPWPAASLLADRRWSCYVWRHLVRFQNNFIRFWRALFLPFLLL